MESSKEPCNFSKAIWASALTFTNSIVCARDLSVMEVGSRINPLYYYYSHSLASPIGTEEDVHMLTDSLNPKHEGTELIWFRYSKYHGCSLRRQDINTHDIDYVE